MPRMLTWILLFGVASGLAGCVVAPGWRSYGDDPLPSGREALDEPFRVFPSSLVPSALTPSTMSVAPALRYCRSHSS